MTANDDPARGHGERVDDQRPLPELPADLVWPLRRSKHGNPGPSPGAGGSHGRQSDLLSVEEATKKYLEFLRIDRERNAALPEPYEWKGKRKGKGRRFGRR